MKSLRGYLSLQAKLSSLLPTAWYSCSCMSNPTSGHWICKNVFFDQYIASMFGKQNNSQQLFKDWKASETGFQNSAYWWNHVHETNSAFFFYSSVVHLYHQSGLPFVITSITQNLSSLEKKGRLKTNKNKKRERLGGNS